MNGGARIGRQLAAMTVLMMALVVAIGIIGALLVQSNAASAMLQEEILLVNDARQGLVANTDIPTADQALSQAQEALRHAAQSRTQGAEGALMAVTLIAALAICGLSIYLYRSVVMPFRRLESFAEEVAAGNLDAPLAHGRANPFGRFTWAFDAMRTDLKRAQEAEARANEAHKTALASLSHDLRTPLASLRTYAEALEMGLDRTPEERASYEQMIMAKCDEASQLVEGLFEHALTDMDRIQVSCTPTEVAPLIKQAAASFANVAEVRATKVESATLNVDGQRITQIVENLIGNGLKYAPDAAIVVEGSMNGGAYHVTVRDFGPGVDAEDLPFLTDRFYRGKNAGDAAGAGLGLFIVAYLVRAMDGTVRIQNAHPGLTVEAAFPIPASEPLS